MSIITETEMSCGVDILRELNPNIKSDLNKMVRHLNHRECATIIWSDIFGRNRRGNKLYHLVKKHFPKSNVVRTLPKKNPNSGNIICTYMFTPNLLEITKYCRENRI